MNRRAFLATTAALVVAPKPTPGYVSGGIGRSVGPALAGAEIVVRSNFWTAEDVARIFDVPVHLIVDVEP